MEETHSRLSPSHSERWLNCPPSLTLCENTPKPTTTAHASEGKLAHNCAECALNQQQYLPEADKAMMEYAEEYAAYCHSLIPLESRKRWGAEVRVQIPLPDCYGTLDFFSTDGDNLHIVDYKYGQGVFVNAHNNTQLMLYAVGMCEMLGEDLSDSPDVHLHIYQPRLNNIQSCKLTHNELLDWFRSITQKAEQALEGGGTFSAGKHCQFCSVRTTCLARATCYLGLASSALMDGYDISGILGVLPQIKQWANDVEQEAIAQLKERERSIAGWKLIKGQGRRAIVNPAPIIDACEARHIPIDTYQPRSLVGIGELDKLLGKIVTSQLQLHDRAIAINEASPKLARWDDPRPSYKRTAQEDFKDV